MNSSLALEMAKEPGKNLGEGISEAVRIVVAGSGDKGKKSKKKPHILVTSIRLVKGSLRKGACRNRNTPTGVMCGSVWRTETRTLKGRLVNVRCLICREVKRVTKFGEKLAKEEEVAKKQSRR